MILVVDSANPISGMTGELSGEHIYAATVAASDVSSLVQKAGSGDYAIRIPVFRSDPNPVDEDSLSSFSSRGPTKDGRIKPDVLAPGESIRSSRSDGLAHSLNCGPSALLSMEGTSMATPITAGAAAMVRQYFVQGYYPTGLPVAANSLDPTAALVPGRMK